MKCLVLAGGIGERLWPLSRKNFPKQFIELQKNHSVFQETIARNIPFVMNLLLSQVMNIGILLQIRWKPFRESPIDVFLKKSLEIQQLQ